MKVYRLSAHNYIHDRTETGARLFGGRWNPEGCACLYTSAHVSLAFLEKCVHAQSKENMNRIGLLQIEIPDEDLILHTDEKQLKPDWDHDISYSQWIGAQILIDLSVVAFSVPSAIIPSERNYILNPRATHFGALRFAPITNFKTDFRLLNGLLS